MKPTMLFLSIFLIASIGFANTSDRIRGYLIQQGYTSSVDFNGRVEGERVLVERKAGTTFIALWDVEGITEPTAQDLPTKAVAKALIATAKQSVKSTPLKTIENRWITMARNQGVIATNAVSFRKSDFRTLIQRVDAMAPTPQVAAMDKLVRLWFLLEAVGGELDDIHYHE